MFKHGCFCIFCSCFRFPVQVLQELDDLVNDLSNIGFLQTSDVDQDTFSSTTQTKSTTPSTNNTFDFSKQQPERTGSLPKRQPSAPQSTNTVNVRRNSTKDTLPPRGSTDAIPQVLRQSLEDLRKSKPVSNKPKPPPKPPVSLKPNIPKKPVSSDSFIDFFNLTSPTFIAEGLLVLPSL